MNEQEAPMVVGITGGIAAGKSSVAAVFRELGAAVVDADALSRAVTRSGSETLERIVQVFGTKVLDSTGGLDRAALGRIVFSDPAARQRLERIVHPAVMEAARLRIEEAGRQGHRLVFYEAALLVETGRHEDMDRLIVVVADDPKRVERLMQRDAMTEEEAIARLQTQLPQADKAMEADHVIDNSGSPKGTRQQVEDLWARLQTVGI